MVAAVFTQGNAYAASPSPFTLESMLGYPFPATLVAGDDGHSIAWVIDDRGIRNLWFAQAPGFTPCQLTQYTVDDGQELTNVHVSRDGKYAVFVRGGDHDANWPDPLQPDPLANPVQPQVQVWSVSTAGGQPKLLGDGDAPAIAPDGSSVAYIHEPDQAVWSVPIDGSQAAKQLFFDRGEASDLQWSSDGKALAFVSTRSDHSFIAIYRNPETPMEYVSPTTSLDVSPRWSPDGTRIAFIRLPGDGGPPQSPLDWQLMPWSIVVADAKTGAGHSIWRSPDTLRGSYPQDGGDPHLSWAAGDRITFLSEMDNWPHLYSVAANGGTATLLTPGAFMIEDLTLTPDRTHVVYVANTGTTPGDGDRRHLFSVDVASGAITTVTHGASSEWSPAIAGDSIAFAQATAQQPPLVSVQPLASGAARALVNVPPDFPLHALVTPVPVTFHAVDGLLVHGQLFRKAGTTTKQPGIIFVHGGPPRQMLVTWHYMDYYTNSYAVNQYLANHGFTVLSVNYRLGLGYGHDYQYPQRWGPGGASEYQDVVAGAKFLQHQRGVDASRIGIWGGSYGGYLTAMGLAHNSDIFKAGVDFHGVHDWSMDLDDWYPTQLKRYQELDLKPLMKEAWESSPDSAIATWRSPVLLIQGDDDRNVKFNQMVDLVQRLQRARVPFDQLVIPNEIHGFLRYASWLEADQATVDYLARQLKP